MTYTNLVSKLESWHNYAQNLNFRSVYKDMKS